MSLWDKITTGSSVRPSDSIGSVVEKFLDASNIDQATEIENPDGFTFFELTCLYCASEKEQREMLGIKGKRQITDADYLAYFGKRKKINMIPNLRKSRQEAVQVALGTQLVEEKKVKDKFLEGIGTR
jgi:hypothetical protein